MKNNSLDSRTLKQMRDFSQNINKHIPTQAFNSHKMLSMLSLPSQQMFNSSIVSQINGSKLLQNNIKSLNIRRANEFSKTFSAANTRRANEFNRTFSAINTRRANEFNRTFHVIDTRRIDEYKHTFKALNGMKTNVFLMSRQFQAIRSINNLNKLSNPLMNIREALNIPPNPIVFKDVVTETKNELRDKVKTVENDDPDIKNLTKLIGNPGDRLTNRQKNNVNKLSSVLFSDVYFNNSDNHNKETNREQDSNQSNSYTREDNYPVNSNESSNTVININITNVSNVTNNIYSFSKDDSNQIIHSKQNLIWSKVVKTLTAIITICSCVLLADEKYHQSMNAIKDIKHVINALIWIIQHH